MEGHAVAGRLQTAPALEMISQVGPTDPDEQAPVAAPPPERLQCGASRHHPAVTFLLAPPRHGQSAAASAAFGGTCAPVYAVSQAARVRNCAVVARLPS